MNLLYATLLVSLALAAFARPPVVHPLGQDSENPYRYTGHSEPVSGFGQKTVLSFDIEHHPDVVSLTAADYVVDVTCTPDTLTVTLAPGTPRLPWAVGTMLVGGREWECKNADGKLVSIRRRIVSVEDGPGNTLVIQTSTASMKELLRHADIHITHNHWTNPGTAPEPPAAGKSAEQKSPQQHTRSTKWWPWDQVVSAVRAVERVVSTVAHVFTAIANLVENGGDANYSGAWDLFSTSWNYAGNDQAETQEVVVYEDKKDNDQITCRDCYAYFQLTLSAGFTIQDYELSNAYVELDGSAALVETLLLTASRKKSNHTEIQLADLQLGEHYFSVGPIPLDLNFSVPIFLDLGYRAEAQLDATVSSNMQGTLGLGIAYGGIPSKSLYLSEYTATSHNDWYSLMHHSLSAGWDMNGRITGELTLWAALIPVLTVEVDEVCEITFTVSPTITGTATATMSDDLDSDWDYSLTATVNANIALSATVQASANILGYQLPEWKMFEIDPVEVWNKDYSWSTDDFSQKLPVRSAALPQPVEWATRPAIAREPLRCRSECVQATGLQTCSFMNGMSVCASSDLSVLEAQVQSFLRNMSVVGAGCAEHVLGYACSLYIPLCSVTTPDTLVPLCHSDCHDALSLCAMTATERHSICDSLAVSPMHPAAAAGEPCEMLPQVTATKTCVVASDLHTCSTANGHKVQLLSTMFDTLAEADLFVQQKLASQESSSSTCMDAARAALCAEYIPECSQDESSSLRMCHSTCVATFQHCEALAEVADTVCGMESSTVLSQYVAPSGDNTCSRLYEAIVVPPSSVVAGTPIAVIVGASVGAFCGLVLIVVGLFVVRKKCVAAAAAKKDTPMQQSLMVSSV